MRRFLNSRNAMYSDLDSAEYNTTRQLKKQWAGWTHRNKGWVKLSENDKDHEMQNSNRAQLQIIGGILHGHLQKIKEHRMDIRIARFHRRLQIHWQRSHGGTLRLEKLGINQKKRTKMKDASRAIPLGAREKTKGKPRHTLSHESYNEAPPKTRKRSPNRKTLPKNKKQKRLTTPISGACQSNNLTSKTKANKKDEASPASFCERRPSSDPRVV